MLFQTCLYLEKAMRMDPPGGGSVCYSHIYVHHARVTSIPFNNRASEKSARLIWGHWFVLTFVIREKVYAKPIENTIFN